MQHQQLGNRSENVGENTADSQVREERGGVVGGGAPGIRAEISLQSIAKTMVSEDVPLQLIEVRGGADRLLQPVNVAEGGFDSVGSPCWNRQAGRSDILHNPHSPICSAPCF